MASAFRQAPRAFSSGFTAGSNREINIERLRLEAKRQRFSDSLSLRREERADEELELRRSQARQQRLQHENRTLSTEQTRIFDENFGTILTELAEQHAASSGLADAQTVDVPDNIIEIAKREATMIMTGGNPLGRRQQAQIDSKAKQFFRGFTTGKDENERRFTFPNIPPTDFSPALGRSITEEELAGVSGGNVQRALTGDSFGRSITEQEELEGLSNDDFARRLDAARNQQTEQPPPRQQRRIRGTSVHF